LSLVLREFADSRLDQSLDFRCRTWARKTWSESFLAQKIEVGVAARARIDDCGKVARKIVSIAVEVGKWKREGDFQRDLGRSDNFAVAPSLPVNRDLAREGTAYRNVIPPRASVASVVCVAALRLCVTFARPKSKIFTLPRVVPNEYYPFDLTPRFERFRRRPLAPNQITLPRRALAETSAVHKREERGAPQELLGHVAESSGKIPRATGWWPELRGPWT